VREHLRACARCRATMRAYRAAPRIAVAFTPALPPSRSLLERVQELLAGLGSRLQGIGPAGDSVAAQFVAASCLAIAALPGGAPATQPNPESSNEHAVERAVLDSAHRVAAQSEPRQQSERPSLPAPARHRAAAAERREDSMAAPLPMAAPPPEVAEEEIPEEDAYEYVPPPAAPPPALETPEASAGSAAGEFGP
jgi:hypothetical protein